MGLKHIPVMVEEVMAFLKCETGRTYVDATLGGGGHASEILKRTAPDGALIGMEWDEDALAEAKNVLMPFGDRVKIFRENFIHLSDLMKAESVDGILLDLGLSSIQLEKEGRGFSFKGDGPLDMRMDQRMNHTAAHLINHLSLEELEYTLSLYGEERWAKRIAKAIGQEREREPIRTTQTLRKIIHHAIPRRFYSWRIDPATRTFQALRIRVNDELENLRKLLETGWKILKKGGRMCILSFHSLEDRMVKETFRTLEKQEEMRVLTKKPVTPSEEERKKNPRSRSAKLRCAERI
ncbi:MAG: 16S rRNA (cytosine(1402)-N(4))-methyltransferase [Deltaproteobacteria bacterium CG03_land_8_20_14_0_80_45_14]|nr:MAG: 16S rRNA (cytosine(1402)-N(4))-methyltransferase [Deltaproteobacteria bacterium CG03_land_8_20_14_0_80_45_14]